MNELHNALSRQLKAVVPNEEFQAWFQPVSFSVENDEAVVSVPNRFYEAWIKDHYLETLEKAIRTAENRPLKLRFEIKPLSPEARPKIPAEKYKTSEPGQSTLAARYTFNNFVIGPCNELAHAACLSAAERPGKVYNPLVLYGGAGLGKSHLLHAAGHLIKQRNPNAKVHYSSLESYTNELIDAIRTEGVASFHNKYRNMDCLLIDDIQFLAKRERTQEELFHTFNTLFEAERQIIMTSDKLPREIHGLEKRLVTRFEWGLLADLQPPEEETKIAILQNKALEKGIELPRDVAFLLAQQPETNVRVLEGYLNRVIAVSRHKNRDLSAELVKEVLVPLLGERQITADEVMKLVSHEYGVRVADITGAKKSRDISLPRQISMYLIRRLTRLSYPEIGRLMGGKDHSTVVKGVKKMNGLMEEDHEFARKLRNVEKKLMEQSRRRIGELTES